MDFEEAGVYAAAKYLNATVETSGHRTGTRIEVEAPRGHIWAEGMGVHVLVAEQCDGEDPANAWLDLRDRMRYGIEKCDTTDCDYCTDPAWETA